MINSDKYRLSTQLKQEDPSVSWKKKIKKSMTTKDERRISHIKAKANR